MNSSGMHMNKSDFKLLCEKYDTDKGNYDWFYEKALGPHRDAPVKILEIGVRYGSSIQVFNEYFNNAEIYGIDCSGRWKNNAELLKPNINIFEGSQSSLKTLYDVYEKSGPLDIIIDDGSHFVEDILASFEFFKDKFTKLYIIEDTVLTLYGWHYRIVNSTNIKEMTALEEDNNRSVFQNRDLYEQYWSSEIRDLDNLRLQSPYKSITYYQNLVCIEK